MWKHSDILIIIFINKKLFLGSYNAPHSLLVMRHFLQTCSWLQSLKMAVNPPPLCQADSLAHYRFDLYFKSNRKTLILNLRTILRLYMHYTWLLSITVLLPMYQRNSYMNWEAYYAYVNYRCLSVTMQQSCKQKGRINVKILHLTFYLSSIYKTISNSPWHHQKNVYPSKHPTALLHSLCQMQRLCSSFHTLRVRVEAVLPRTFLQAVSWGLLLDL